MEKILAYKNLRERVLMCIIMHGFRYRYYDKIEKCLNFLSIVLGAAAFSDFSSVYIQDESVQKIIPKAIGAILGIIGAGQLVFSFSTKSKEHLSTIKDMRRLFISLESLPKTESNINKWNHDYLNIISSAPHVKSILEDLAINEARYTFGLRDNGFIDISFFDLVFNGYNPFNYRCKNKSDLNNPMP